MCWSVPGRITEITDKSGTVELSGVKKKISLDLVPEVSVGDYVLIHAGYAIQKVDQEKARFTIDFFKGKLRDA